METFTLRARLASPVIKRGSMTLDALLMAVLGQGDVSSLLKCVDSLYFASSGTVDPYAAPVAASYVASMRPEHTPEWLGLIESNTFNADLGVRDGAKGRAKLNDLRIGLARQREAGNILNGYRAEPANCIEWYAVGNPEAVLAVVKDVPFLGKRRSSGYGEVVKWELEPSDLDGICGYFGEPLRPIPVQRWDHGGDWIPVEAAWKAPYWDVRNRTKCYVPGLP